MDVIIIVPVSLVEPTPTLCLSEAHSDLKRALTFCAAVLSCSTEELIASQSQLGQANISLNDCMNMILCK